MPFSCCGYYYYYYSEKRVVESKGGRITEGERERKGAYSGKGFGKKKKNCTKEMRCSLDDNQRGRKRGIQTEDGDGGSEKEREEGENNGMHMHTMCNSVIGAGNLCSFFYSSILLQ